MFSLKARWAVASGIVVIFLTGATIYTTLEKEVTIREGDKSLSLIHILNGPKPLLYSSSEEKEIIVVVRPWKLSPHTMISAELSGMFFTS